jgi:uroporphyrin-III C-methyltransferase/precorrin-2 dehydrogenase/sirohydrochlorin ferrochelatase
VRYFPIFLDLKDKTVSVFGGGDAAANKLRLFAKTEARLVCTALAFNPEIASMILSGRVAGRILDPAWASFGDAAVIIAATESEADATIAERAQSLGLLVNAVDKTSLCSFITPSIVDRSPVVVAVGTEGEAPVLARRVREKIETALPERLGDLARFIGRNRERAGEVFPDTPRRRKLWEDVVDGPVGSLMLEGEDGRAQSELDAMLDRVSVDGRSGPALHQVMVMIAPVEADDLTLKAFRSLQNADALFYDDLVPEAILERARRDAARHPSLGLPLAESIMAWASHHPPARSVAILSPPTPSQTLQHVAQVLRDARFAVSVSALTAQIPAS